MVLQDDAFWQMIAVLLEGDETAMQIGGIEVLGYTMKKAPVNTQRLTHYTSWHMQL